MSTGEFAAFKADDGKRLWSTQTNTGIVAPPMTYEAGGEQYVVVELGWGGAFPLSAGELARGTQPTTRTCRACWRSSSTARTPCRLHLRRCNASSTRRRRPLRRRSVAQGKAHYHSYCNVCHGDSAVSSGVLPDLRYSAALPNPATWQSIVHDGVLQGNGMIAFCAGTHAPGDREHSRLRDSPGARADGGGQRKAVSRGDGAVRREHSPVSVQ